MSFRKLGMPLFSLGLNDRFGIGNAMGAFSIPYEQRLIDIVGLPYLTRYYPMNTRLGTPNDRSSNSALGTYLGSPVFGEPGIAPGEYSVRFPAGSGLNIYSSAFNTAWLEAVDEMSIGCFFKPPSLTWWSDGILKYLWDFRSDANNERDVSLQVSKFFRFGNVANGIDKKQTLNDSTEVGGVDYGGGSTDWISLIVTISRSQDRAWVYVNGSTVIDFYIDGLGVWAGNLSSARAMIGALNNVVQGSCQCNMAHFFIASRALTMTECARLSNPYNDNLIKIFAVGDSCTENALSWPLYLINQTMNTKNIRMAKLPKMHAHAGWTTDDAANGNGGKIQCFGIDVALATYTEVPDLVVFNLGKNDYSAGPNNPGAVWKTNTLYLIDKIHAAYPNAPIYLTKVWEADRGDGLIPICIAAMNIYTDEILADPAYSFVHLGLNENPLLEGGDNGATYYYDIPAVHPNVLGNALWSTSFRTLLGW